MIAAILITALYDGREVLVPLALAILMSFVLTPPLLFLRRLGLPRVLGVGLLVTSAFVALVALGWLMSREVSQLAFDLPRYQSTLATKISEISKSTADSPAIRRITQAFQNFQQELAHPKPETSVGTMPAPPEQVEDRKKPVAVEIREPEPRPLEIFQRLAGTLLPPIATAGIVVLFVIFILLQREDLRDRLIRLFGTSDIQRSTEAINDAADRLSRYFVTQLAINSAFGVFIAFGLWLIGVPSPTVWGILAMLMRFVPFIGAYIAAAPPVILAAIVKPGWTTFILTAGLYLVSELAMGQVVEPLAYGRGTGLTPLAIVIATVVWTWLWGPIGLLLATPLTVVAVVMGRHIEGLQFFDVLLGDRPALTPEQRFYQRLLSGDSAESADQLETCVNEGAALATCFDTVVLQALRFAQHDADRGALDETDLARIETTIKEVIDDLRPLEAPRWFQEPKQVNGEAERTGGLAELAAAEEENANAVLPLEPGSLAPGWDADGAVVCVGVRTALDDAAAALISALLAKAGLKPRLLDSEAISPATSLDLSEAKLVCLSYLTITPSPAHVRYLVRRLRTMVPTDCLIVVGHWSSVGVDTASPLEKTGGADAYVTSFRRALEIIVQAAAPPRNEDAPSAEKPVRREPSLRVIAGKSD